MRRSTQGRSLSRIPLHVKDKNYPSLNQINPKHRIKYSRSFQFPSGKSRIQSLYFSSIENEIEKVPHLPDFIDDSLIIELDKLLSQPKTTCQKKKPMMPIRKVYKVDHHTKTNSVNPLFTAEQATRSSIGIKYKKSGTMIAAS